jgi:hypothetical protein
MSFHLTYVSKEYHWVCLMRLQSLWYIWRKPCTYLASRLIRSPNGPKWAFTWPTSPRSNIRCASKVFHPIVHSAQSCTYLAPILILSPNGWKRASTWHTSPRSTIGLPKMISMPVEYSAQTVHLSCAEINTIFKQTETSLYFTNVTLEYHRVCPKWFMSLWYIWRKLCTYHASRLILSPNGLKRASNSPTSHRSSIGCAQNDCHAHGAFGANPAPILRRH